MSVAKIKSELIERHTPAPYQKAKGGSVESMSEFDLGRIIDCGVMSFISARKNDFIISKIHERKSLGGKIVEVGSGTGINLFSYYRQGIDNLFGIDYDDEAVEFSKNVAEVMGYDIHFRQGNIVELHNIIGFEEANIVIVDSVLEHIIEYREAISSIMKTLTPGGLALIIVPSLLGGYSLMSDIDYRKLRWKGQKENYDPAEHVNHFWFREIANEFVACGGKIRECHKFQAYRAFFMPFMKFKAWSFLEILDYYFAQILPVDIATRTIVVEKNF